MIFVSVFLLSSVSAEYGYNKIGGGATVSIKNNVTYYINGTFLDAGGYYLYNDTTSIYLNDTRLNETIDARASAGEVLWSANYTLYNDSWSSINNATYNEAWLFVTNGSFYPLTSNPFGYLNTSSEVNWDGNYSSFLDVWEYLTNNTFYLNTNPSGYIAWTDAVNGTLAFNSSLINYYPLDNPFGYLNTTADSFAGNYSDFLILFNNDFGFYNSSDFDINDYYLKDNPFSFYNSTTLPANSEPNWNANYSNFLTLFNNDFDFYNISDFDIADYYTSTQTDTAIESANTTLYDWIVAQEYASGGLDWGDVVNGTLYLSSNPYGFYNLTSWDNPYTYFNLTNFPNYANIYLNTTNQYNYTNFTLLSEFENDLTFYVDNVHNYTNFTLLSEFENDAGFLTAFTEADPFWSDNFTLYNSSWSAGISWADAINGTLYLSDNPFGFYNSTTWDNPYLYYNETSLTTNSQLLNGFGFYNLTNWDNPFNYTNFTVLSDYTNDLDFYVDNTHNYTNFTKLSDYENDLSFYLDNTHSYFNLTTWNNPFTYFNSTSYPNYANVYLNTSNQFSYYNSTSWNNPYAYWNSTFATFNKTYADTLYSTISEPKWTGNSTLVPYLASANVFTNNNTLEGLKFEGDTTNHVIYDNATCIFIKGDTSVLEIC